MMATNDIIRNFVNFPEIQFLRRTRTYPKIYNVGIHLLSVSCAIGIVEEIEFLEKDSLFLQNCQTLYKCHCDTDIILFFRSNFLPLKY